jgi:hypothetical protein
MGLNVHTFRQRAARRGGFWFGRFKGSEAGERVRLDPRAGSSGLYFDEDALTRADGGCVDYCLLVPDRYQGEACRPTRVVQGFIILSHVRDAVIENHEHVRAVILAEPVAGAEVLVDPYMHSSRIGPRRLR